MINFEKLLIQVTIAIAFSLLLIILKKYFNGSNNKYFPNLKNKIIIVTGSNTGIGYETALEFAKLSPKVLILACRDEKRANEAIKKIKEQTNNETIVKFISLDLSDLLSV